MKKYVKAAAALCLCLAVFGGAAGVSGAYLWKPVNELNNVITPGSVEIKLTEPGWDAEKGKNLVPCETVGKDPIVTNTGKNDAWVFQQVDVPIRHVILVDGETKRKKEAADTELFFFTHQEGWTLISKTIESGVARRLYGYETILKPGETTTPLFTELTFANVLEGELDERERLTVPIQAVAIQSNVENAEDGLAAIYSKYLEQEAADKSGESENEDGAAETENGKPEAGAGGTEAGAAGTEAENGEAENEKRESDAEKGGQADGMQEEQ